MTIYKSGCNKWDWIRGEIHPTWKTTQNPSHMENYTKAIPHGKLHKRDPTWKTTQKPSHMENDISNTVGY